MTPRPRWTCPACGAVLARAGSAWSCSGCDQLVPELAGLALLVREPGAFVAGSLARARAAVAAGRERCELIASLGLGELPARTHARLRQVSAAQLDNAVRLAALVEPAAALADPGGVSDELALGWDGGALCPI